MTTDAVRVYTAGEVPALRRDLAEYYGYRYEALVLGQQPTRPSELIAKKLAAAEAARLSVGDLWFIDEDLCALLAAAYPSMPAFAPRPTDLPSTTGFAVFAEPIAMYPAGIAPRNDVIDLMAEHDGDDELHRVADRMHADRVVAVSWGPIDKPHWPAGGVWMSFYAESHLGQAVDDSELARRAMAMLPTLTVDNEAVVAWRPNGVPADGYLIEAEDQTTTSWARLLFAAFQLAAQTDLAETQTERTPRAERRRTQHAGLPERDVRIVRLHRNLTADRETDPGATGGRDWRPRWVARGHWRNHWYPSLQDHRPLWIAPT